MTRSKTVAISSAVFAGLDPDHVGLVRHLVEKVNGKRHRNELRRRYYDGLNVLKDLGISIPPSLRSVEVVAGWPAKAVDAMSRRTVLEGFDTTQGGQEVKSLVGQIWEDNRLDAEAPAAHTSALMHSCSFGFVTQGDQEASEPAALITAQSAENATGDWDRRRRCLGNGLSIINVDAKSGQPTLMNLYTPNRVEVMRLVRPGLYDVETIDHTMGVPVELLPFRASLERPFGRSRITRAVMYHTDSAMRTMLRSEVGAEFYNAPQRYALGADEEAFVDKDGNPVPAWSVMLGRLLTLSRDEDGNLPQVGQFAQQTMQPNIEQLRSIAMMFAGETSLPAGSLGIIQDNPESADAIRARNEDLGMEIEHWQKSALGPAWRRLMLRAVAMSTDSPAALAEARSLRSVWGSWSAPSEVSRAQASLARVQAVPRLAETDVELSRMGYTPQEIESMRAQWAREASRANLTAILESARGQSAAAAAEVLSAPAQEAAPTPTVADDADALKKKFDAIGVATRAGVDQDDAASRLGLEGLKFTGAMPVSLRMPESEAASLEEK